MKVLLDTHAFLWWGLDDHRLSDRVREIIRDGRSDVLLSAASVWEVALKVSKGRLDLPGDLDAFVADRLRRDRWAPLAIDEHHAVRAASLPKIHGDPFDRMLIAQSQLEGIPLLTGDSAITRYDVETIW